MAYTKQNTRIERWQSDVFYVSGVASAVSTQVFMRSQLVNDADGTDVVQKPWESVSFELFGTTGNITAAGKTVTYSQLAALMGRAALDQANLGGIN